MNFFKIFFITLLLTIAGVSYADNHDQKKEVLEGVKEIAKQLEDDEEVPLNDPFAGNEGTSSMSSIPEDEQDNEMSLYNFKLVGIMNGEYESYVSLINSTGEVVTLQLNEELSPGIRLVGLKPKQAIFEKGDNSFLIINFKNQIKETSESF